MGRASKVVFVGALCVTLMGALSCGGQRAQRAEPAEGASAQDAQGRPLVEMDGGSLRALSAEEEARFVEAAASVTCAWSQATSRNCITDSGFKEPLSTRKQLQLCGIPKSSISMKIFVEPSPIYVCL